MGDGEQEDEEEGDEEQELELESEWGELLRCLLLSLPLAGGLGGGVGRAHGTTLCLAADLQVGSVAMLCESVRSMSVEGAVSGPFLDSAGKCCVPDDGISVVVTEVTTPSGEVCCLHSGSLIFGSDSVILELSFDLEDLTY